MATEHTRLIYMTTGVLLQKLVLAKSLTEYSHIFVDEVCGQKICFYAFCPASPCPPEIISRVFSCLIVFFVLFWGILFMLYQFNYILSYCPLFSLDTCCLSKCWVKPEGMFPEIFFLCGKKRPHKTLGVLSSSVLTENWPHSHNILKNWYIRMYRICAEVFLCVWQGSWAQRRDGLSIVGVEKTPSFQLSSCQGN